MNKILHKKKRCKDLTTMHFRSTYNEHENIQANVLQTTSIVRCVYSSVFRSAVKLIITLIIFSYLFFFVADRYYTSVLL